MKETSFFHGIPISSLMEPKTNCVEMVVVNDFVTNGILMEPKTILTEMKMANDFQMKGQGVYYIVSFQIHHGA